MLAVRVLDDGDALKFIPSGSLAIDVLKSEDVGRLEDLVVVVDQVPAGEVVDVHADLDFPRLHLVQLDAGVEAGKQDHGAKYQQKDEDREEAPHTRFFDLLHFLSDLILLVVVRIELAAVQNVVYVLQFEPLEQIQRRLDERPIHYHLQLSKKGNCPDPLIAVSDVFRFLVHKRVPDLKLFIAELELECTQRKVDTVQDVEPFQIGVARVVDEGALADSRV